ncbi:SDR family oxidoreductase [Stappia taiwanensis]|uniref:SDR family oxidoreductase n=1 Tax=Stappia taiwanensis TaxID=992267 RepID=A0A838XS05_9HYPH|nr:SDR family oxidoreductase [Stappia taiwanensis]MBA4611448.1 SDR family oxidoreductase [Stappia taiwanensis]GGF00227.1 3-oxoacyl-ACP reductase [Stappia taiwanensis]
MTLLDLTGRVAVVTGASSGLGAHFARTLGEAGAAVALIARNGEKLEAVAAPLRADGIDVRCAPADITDRPALEAAVAGIADWHGRIDVLVNNAGIARTERFLDMSEADWAAVVDTDLTGLWRAGQIVARVMAAGERGGSIVNIASILGLAVQPTQTNYAAAKAGVLHLTRAMARELGRYGIRVNAIAPGYFKTDINSDFFDSDAGQALIGKLFPRRLGRLSELDGPLLLLASQAGSFMTGTTLTVDGGTLLSGV